MAHKAIDTAALLDFFKDGPVAGQVEDLLVRAEKAKHRVLISALSWGDVYLFARKQSVAAAERLIKELEALPIEVIANDERLELAQAAAEFQAEGKVLSVSDAYAAAVAKVYRAELWTASGIIAALKGEIRVRYLSEQ